MQVAPHEREERGPRDKQDRVPALWFVERGYDHRHRGLRVDKADPGRIHDEIERGKRVADAEKHERAVRHFQTERIAQPHARPTEGDRDRDEVQRCDDVGREIIPAGAAERGDEEDERTDHAQTAGIRELMVVASEYRRRNERVLAGPQSPRALHKYWQPAVEIIVGQMVKRAPNLQQQRAEHREQERDQKRVPGCL